MNFENNFEKENTNVEEENGKVAHFYEKIFKKDTEDKSVYISLEDLKEAKEVGVELENLLNYASKKEGLLMHGTITEIDDSSLKSAKKEIFASDKAAIAIMRSLYSNRGVNLDYPYFISDNDPMSLTIHKGEDEPIIKEKGFVYLVEKAGFENNPEGSWQYIKNTEEVNICGTIETEGGDFNYPVEVKNDLAENKEKL